MSDEEVETPELRGIELLKACEEKRNRTSKKQHKRKMKTKDTTEQQIETDKKKLDKVEADLEDIVFGGNFKEDSESETDVEHKKRKVVPHSADSDLDESEDDQPLDNVEATPEKEPVWEDEDDDILVQQDGGNGDSSKTMASLLREKHEKIFSRPQWASKAEKKNREKEADELLRTASTYIDKDSTGRPLGSGQLDFTRCPQMNKFCFQRSALTSIAFHPTSEIAMLAHRNGAVSFLSVAAKECNKIQSVFFKDFEISCAKLSSDGMQMFCGSAKHRTLHCYDLMSGSRSQVVFPKAHELTHMKKFDVSPDGRYIAVHGRFGNIYLICAETKQQIGTLKMNEEVTSINFSSDGQMLSHGGNYVYMWDLASRRCSHKFLDDGCLKGQAMALSQNNRYLATGCDSGIVNIYDFASLKESRTPKPLKCIKNLVTPVTSVQFNPSSESLLMASRFKPEAIKMLHTGSLTVFSNFPNPQHHFNSTSCVAFSPHGGFIGLGTTLGAANLVRLNHFSNY